MGGDRHAGRLGGHRRVDLADVAQVLVFSVVATGSQQGPLTGIVQVGETGVVELEISATQVRQGGHLVCIGSAQVVPELLDVGVDTRVDGGRAAPVVHHARRRDGQLRRRGRGRLLEESERLTENGRRQGDLVVDTQGGGLERDGALRVVKLDLQPVIRRPDPAELVDEVHVPCRPAELAIGRRLEADVLLSLHHCANGVVLSGAELLRRHAAGGEVLAGLKHRLWSQQTTDVVSPKRRHVASLSASCRREQRKDLRRPRNRRLVELPLQTWWRRSKASVEGDVDAREGRRHLRLEHSADDGPERCEGAKRRVTVIARVGDEPQSVHAG